MLYQAPHFPVDLAGAHCALEKDDVLKALRAMGCVAVWARPLCLWASPEVYQPGTAPSLLKRPQAAAAGGRHLTFPDERRAFNPFNLHVKNKRNPEVERTHQERATDERVGKSCA